MCYHNHFVLHFLQVPSFNDQFIGSSSEAIIGLPLSCSLINWSNDMSGNVRNSAQRQFVLEIAGTQRTETENKPHHPKPQPCRFKPKIQWGLQLRIASTITYLRDVLPKKKFGPTGTLICPAESVYYGAEIVRLRGECSTSRRQISIRIVIFEVVNSWCGSYCLSTTLSPLPFYWLPATNYWLPATNEDNEQMWT